MRRFLFLLGLLLAGFLIYFCLSKHAPKIQDDIKLRVTQAFGVENLPDGIKVDGRDVVLTGVVEQDAVKVRAGQVAAGVYGVRVVDNQIQVVEPTPPPPPPVEIVEPEPVPVPVPEPVVVVDMCQEKLAELLEREQINFDSSRATIKLESFDLLNSLADAAKKCDDSIIHIHGHTDSSGNENSNRVLSLSRAKSVGRYLIEKGVVQEVRAFGHGSDKPVADNATVDGRAQNRRIEFKVNKKDN